MRSTNADPPRTRDRHQSERQRRAFCAMLEEPRAEAKRKGVHRIAEIAEEMDAVIADGIAARR